MVRSLLLFVISVAFANANPQWWPSDPEYSAEATGDAPFQTNLGPLPTFSPPASCLFLTANIISDFSEVYSERTDASAPTYYTDPELTFAVSTSTGFLGAGVAWVALNDIDTNTGFPNLEDFTPTKTLPPSECLPSNYFDPVNSDINYRNTHTHSPDYNIDIGIEVFNQYYSPATACPTHWAIANSTVIISATGGTSFTETAALCCPSGWLGNSDEGGCTYGTEGQIFTAVSLLFDSTSAPVTATAEPDNRPFEFAIQIRWQTTDLVPKTATSTGTSTRTSASTGTGISTATPSKSGTEVHLPSIYLLIALLLAAIIQ
jgi:hypothetical protein